MNLHARLRSLERSAAAAAPASCPGCGNRPGDRPEYRLLPIEFDADGFQIHHATGPETCLRCGRRLVVRLLPITIDENHSRFWQRSHRDSA